MKFVPISNAIGVEVQEIDVARAIAPGDFECIVDKWIKHSILLFRKQVISPEQHVEFTKRFGATVSYTREKFNENEHPEILILSNITRDGKLIGSPESGRVWHTDGHYLEEPPAGSMLYAIEVPPVGGETWFANMFLAYDGLPQTIKNRLEGLKVVISRVQSRPYNYPNRPPLSDEEVANWLDMPQPIVRTHPISGRKALYIGGNVPWRIEGMSEDESLPLVTYLQEFCVRPQYTYCHKWQKGDIILWDNRSTLHRATPYDQLNHRRLMHRTTIAGSLPY